MHVAGFIIIATLAVLHFPYPHVLLATNVEQAVPCGMYLEALERMDFDIFHPQLINSQQPLTTQGKIAWAWMRGQY